MRHLLRFLTLGAFLACADPGRTLDLDLRRRALENGAQAREGLVRCQNYLRAWMNQVDPETGLVPRNLSGGRTRKTGGSGDYWNAKDSAADNYPFLVLSAFFTDPQLFEGPLKSLLQTEKRLSTRIQGLPDAFSFATQTFLHPEPDLDRSIFGASEYIKDGLLPVTEWMGQSIWSNRLIELLDHIWAIDRVQTEYGAIPSTNPEVNGEMLQVLARVYWMTEESKYLEWAKRLAAYYLLDHHPADTNPLRLRDHGCEIVSGLCELYATLASVDPSLQSQYRALLFRLLDRILEIGRNEHGLFYNVVDPVTGQIVDSRVSDSWGYSLNGYYTVYLIDGVERYRQAVLKAMQALPRHYRDFDWESGSADGFADSIEGALNLYNREPVESVAGWIDSEIRNMWAKQGDDGIIEGWHGDGNFARTTLMYCLWKTQGLRVEPWSKDVTYGALKEGDETLVVFSSEADWSGRVYFDQPRHRTYFRLPMDWPRINQFPEWTTIKAESSYLLYDSSGESDLHFSGAELIAGIQLELARGEERTWMIRADSDETQSLWKRRVLYEDSVLSPSDPRTVVRDRIWEPTTARPLYLPPVQ